MNENVFALNNGQYPTNIINAKVLSMDGCLLLFHAKTTEWISVLMIPWVK